MTDVILPGLGMGMTDGTIISWHKAVGDRVRRDEPLCDVEAAKTTVEVVATRDGVLQQILVAAGTNVPVSTVIAVIGDEALAPGEAVHAEPATPPAPAPPDPAPLLKPPTAPTRPAAHNARPQTEPRARRAARVHGVDLAQVRGSGPGGRIIEADVIAATKLAPEACPVDAPTTAPASAPVASTRTAVPPDALHQLRVRCDPAPLTALLSELARLDGPAIPRGSIFVKAAALATVRAGVELPVIHWRNADGNLTALAGVSTLSLRAIAEQLIGPANSSAEALSLVIENPADDGLEEAIRYDPQGPASLAFAALPQAETNDRWSVALTYTDRWQGAAAAGRFLKALRDVLENPLAVLA